MYIVMPEHHWWDENPDRLKGRPLEDGFAYTSDTNNEWLSVRATAGDAAVIPYGRQSVDDDDIAAVVEVLRSDWLTQGPADQPVRGGDRRTRLVPSTP